MKRTDTPTLIKAMRILARDIQSGDGVANAAVAEAADRLEELTTWMPIETAPKDRRILLLIGKMVVVGQWHHDQYSKRPRPFWQNDRWQITRSREKPPTHWMPLPDAPTDGEGMPS